MYEWYLKKWSINVSVVIKRNNRWEEPQIQEHYKDYDLQLINLDITQRYSEQEKELRYF